MPSFDVVLKPNLIELRNALDQSNKEIQNRFDFRGSDARIEQADLQLTLYADDDFKMRQVREVLLGKLAKRSVDARYFDFSRDPDKISGGKLKLVVTVRSGIDKDLGKKIVQTIKDAKALKLSASFQGDAVRIQGAKRDNLQAAISTIREKFSEHPLGFENFRA